MIDHVLFTDPVLPERRLVIGAVLRLHAFQDFLRVVGSGERDARQRRFFEDQHLIHQPLSSLALFGAAQIERLAIEKGGDAQLADEVAAYGPMVPNGRELVATVMFEIEDSARRARILGMLGGVENTVSLAFAGETVTARPEGDVARTDEEGKTSSVHFLHFPFTAGQIAKFKAAGTQVTFAIGHPDYHHLAVLPEAVRTALATDFDAV